MYQTSAAKKRKKKNKKKQRSATTTIENGDASSTTSTINDGADSLDHTTDASSPISEATDTRIPVTSEPDALLEPEVTNGSIGLPNGSGKDVPAPVLIHVGDKASNGLPNGFVSKTKMAANSSTSKGNRPTVLGKSVLHVCCRITLLRAGVN